MSRPILPSRRFKMMGWITRTLRQVASDSVDYAFPTIPPATRAVGLVTRWVLLLHRRRELRREDRARQLCQLASKRHAIRYLGVVGHAVTVMQSCFRLLTDDSGLASRRGTVERPRLRKNEKTPIPTRHIGR
jgi:hypothetical protein